MGSGKTSIGRKLAKQLHFQFVDTDEWIENRENRKVPEIFESNGEMAFRKLEHDCLLELIHLENLISL